MNYLNLLWFLPAIILDIWFFIYLKKEDALLMWIAINFMISLVFALIGLVVISKLLIS